MKESSKFYSSLGLLIVLNAVVKPLWIFGIDREVQNTVGTSEYGVYFSLFNLSVVFSFLVDWGLTVFFNQQAASRQQSFISQASHFILVKLFFALVYAGIMMLAGWFSQIERWDLLVGVILVQVLTSFFVFFRNILTARQLFVADAWMSVLDKTLMILLCGSFLLFPFLIGRITINVFLWTQVFSTLLAIMVIVFLLLFKGTRLTGLTRGFLSRKLFIDALPFAVVVFLMSTHSRFDGFLLERLHPSGAFEAGIYASAYRLLDASNTVCYLFAAFLMPYLARQWGLHRQLDGVLTRVRDLLLMFSIAVAVTAFLLAPWIQDLLYHHNHFYSARVLQFVMPTLVGYALVQVYGTAMTATGHIRQLCYITAAAVLVNIALNLWLIPRFGAIGAGIAALCSQLAYGISCGYYVHQNFRLPGLFRALLIYIFTALLLYSLLKIGMRNNINPWLLIGLAAVTSLVIMLATRILPARKWTDFFTNKNP